MSHYTNLATLAFRVASIGLFLQALFGLVVATNAMNSTECRWLWHDFILCVGNCDRRPHYRRLAIPDSADTRPDSLRAA